ncbi:MAG: CAP-associated domain-containing protein [Proteocatella sp.]
MKSKSTILVAALIVLLVMPINNIFASSPIELDIKPSQIPQDNTYHMKNSSPLFIELNKVRINIGDSITEVVKILGEPSRIEPSGFDFDWHVYNSDYRRFIMVGVKDGFVEGLYTNARNFKSNVASYGNINIVSSHPYVKLYFDSNENNKVIAILITKSEPDHASIHNEAFFKAQELQIFDATNTFRVNYCLSPLKYNKLAALTAKNHSKDMAERNYISHFSLNGDSPLQRYVKLGGIVSGSGSCSGENIAAGRMLGIDAFNDWLNSKKHRDNMLGNHVTMGVGFAENSSARYKYYMTQFFTR